MPDGRIVERLLNEIRRARTGYHRLVLLVGPAGTGKGAVLRLAAERSDGHLINVNLELSRQLLDLTTDQRALHFARILEEILGPDDTTVFLRRTEILFDPAFQQDTLRLLRQLSRTRTVVSAWSGTVDGAFLNYAEPGHVEHQRHETEGVSLVEMSAVDSW